jgi:hypothetical protein
MKWPPPRPALAPSYDARHPTYSHPPGPARGLLGRLRQLFGGWLGPRLAHDTPAADHVRREKLAAQPRGVVLPNFLPYFDDQTGETPEMRRYYRRMLAAPEVKSALCGKVFGVLSQELKIVPADRHSARDREVADFVRWSLTERCKGGFPALGWNILVHGLVDGYSVCERVVRPEEKGRFAGKWPLVDLKPKQVGDDLVLQTDEYKNVVGLLGLRYNGGQEFDPADFHLFTFEPLYGQPTGMSDFRAAYGRWWMLDTVLKLRAMGLEKRALPLLVGEYTDSVTNKPSLEAALALARSQSWISVPQGAKVTAVGIAGQADDAFRTAVQDLKHDIFLAIQGAILQSLEGAADSERGNSQVHQSTADLFRWFLSETLVASLNDRDGGLIAAIVDLNYVVDEYPRAVLSGVDVGEMKAEADLDAALIANGLEISKEDAYRRYGRLPPSDARDVLKPAKADGPGGGSGGPPGGGMPFAEGRPAAKGKWTREKGPRGAIRWRRGDEIRYEPPGEGKAKPKGDSAVAGPARDSRSVKERRAKTRAEGRARRKAKEKKKQKKAKKYPFKCPSAGALRTVAKLKKRKNVAKVAVRKLRMFGPEAAVEYLKGKGVHHATAAAAVRAGQKPPPPRDARFPKDPKKRRVFCVGKTPGKYSPVGQQVIERMMGRGQAKKVNGKIYIRSRFREGGKPRWFSLSRCSMGHREDVVKWWNRKGRRYHRPGGNVAPQVRAWMTNPKNYVMEYNGLNFSKGSKTGGEGHRYKPPVRQSDAARPVKAGKKAAG